MDVDSMEDQKEFIKNNKLILKTKLNKIEINKIALSSNDVKRIQWINLLEIKFSNIIKQYTNV